MLRLARVEYGLAKGLCSIIVQFSLTDQIMSETKYNNNNNCGIWKCEIKAGNAGNTQQIRVQICGRKDTSYFRTIIIYQGLKLFYVNFM